MKLAVGSDHGGFNFKQLIKTHLTDAGHEVVDFGPEKQECCDYPEFGLKVARSVAAEEFDQGILICGTGLGMSMTANRVKGVRAALCSNEFMARMARNHNNANVLVLGERVIGSDLALSIVDAYLNADFEGGRHQRRIDLFDYAE